MKKYASFPVDCTTLIAETMAYLKASHDIEATEYQQQSVHLLAQDDISALEAEIPSLGTTFDGLTVTLVAHITVNTSVMSPTSFDGNFVLIPMEDCDDVFLNTFTTAAGAVKDGWNYARKDCTLSTTIVVDGPKIISSGLVHTLTKSTYQQLGDVLLVAFAENTDSYLA